MIKENQKFYVSWGSKNKKHYIKRGYIFTKIGDIFEVKLEDIIKTSHSDIALICDNCGKEFVRPYYKYLECHDNELGDLCNQCKYLKTQRTCQEKYGVSNVFQDNNIKEKIKQTLLDLYGVEHCSQLESMRNHLKQQQYYKYVEHPEIGQSINEKRKQTCLKRYGVLSTNSLPEVIQKKKDACLDKYGVECSLQYPEFQELKIQTWLHNYGVDNPSKSDDVKLKKAMSFYQNGTCPTSKPQIQLQKMLELEYGECQLNFPCKWYSLDCVIQYNNIKIDIEFDGNYWHKDKVSFDNKRDDYVIKHGYKVLRIKSDYKLPSIIDIRNKINILVNTSSNIEIIVV